MGGELELGFSLEFLDRRIPYFVCYAVKFIANATSAAVELANLEGTKTNRGILKA